ncbi:MAG: HIT family protein [Mycoplasma sp.]
MSQKENCIFCKIVNGEIPAKIVGENDLAIAFLDVNPISDGHTLVIPKQHHLDMGTCFKADLRAVWDLAQDVARTLESTKLNPWAFNYLSNQGKIAGQEVFHFHVHVIPKYDEKSGFTFSANKAITENVDDVYDMIFKKIKKFNKKK